MATILTRVNLEFPSILIQNAWARTEHFEAALRKFELHCESTDSTACHKMAQITKW
jgi:hypothetical protein